jgi:hypothetical protein
VRPAALPLPGRATGPVRAFAHTLDQASDGIRIFNPGSPTHRRRQPRGTFGLLRIDDGLLVEARIIPVDT